MIWPLNVEEKTEWTFAVPRPHPGGLTPCSPGIWVELDIISLPKESLLLQRLMFHAISWVLCFHDGAVERRGALPRTTLRLLDSMLCSINE